jgi:hypothetical protein
MGTPKNSMYAPLPYKLPHFFGKNPHDITPEVKYRIKALRIFINMRDAETAHTGGMQGFRQQSRLVKKTVRHPRFNFRGNTTSISAFFACELWTFLRQIRAHIVYRDSLMIK